MSHDLLHNPLIQTDAGWHSLPGLMAAMARGEVGGFPALRPHQRPAWHMFLVQLGVMALDAAGLEEAPRGDEDWRAALANLTADFPGGEPWHLVVPDRRLPAFLQPPDPGGPKWSPVATPDALDMLITARNHDLKGEIARKAAPQDWIFALVSLQTMEGFSGRDNYGIARMNGGSSSRPMLALAPAQAGSAQVDPSGWWRRDVVRLLAGRRTMKGKRLLWLEPWPEGRMLELAALDPLFIEVCRRIRLVEQGGRITAERSTSKGPRINAKEAKGHTGDPWTPVHVAQGKALTLGERDWTHRLLVDLLFSAKREWHIPPLAREHAQEAGEPMLLVAETFSRGNSKTDGFRSRVVPVPKAMVTQLFGDRPVSVAADILEDIATAETALSSSLFLVGSEGDEEKRKKNLASQKVRNRINRYIAPACEALQRQADVLFFPELWARMAVTEDAGFTFVRLAFLERLAGIARAEFGAALPAIPCPSLMRPRAEVRGRDRLDRGLGRALSKLQQPETAHG